MTLPTYDAAAAFDAIVLAGGSATRFGSDKLGALVDGVPLLDRVLAASSAAHATYVVGDPRPVGRDVTWLRERPAGSGPANAVVTGLASVTADKVVLLAGDLPYVTADTIARLVAASVHRPAALVDAHGRTQYLCSVFATERLRETAARRGSWAGASMRTLLAPLRLELVPARDREAHDVDTPHDVRSDP